MVKKIRLLGMVIDNFSLREEVMQGEEFYNRSELNIIRTISMKMLSMAADDQVIRDGITQADLLIVGDEEILTEAGIYSNQRLREASEHGFMQEYLKRMSRCGRQIFLVAKDWEELEMLQEYLNVTYEKMQIVGSYVLEECGGDYDMVVNEINAAAPDVLLSVLGSPEEEEFLLEAKAKIGARVWYSLGEDYNDTEGRLPFVMRFRQLIHRGKFKNVIHHYEDGNE